MTPREDHRRRAVHPNGWQTAGTNVVCMSKRLLIQSTLTDTTKSVDCIAHHPLFPCGTMIARGVKRATVANLPRPEGVGRRHGIRSSLSRSRYDGRVYCVTCSTMSQEDKKREEDRIVRQRLDDLLREEPDSSDVLLLEAYEKRLTAAVVSNALSPLLLRT